MVLVNMFFGDQLVGDLLPTFLLMPERSLLNKRGRLNTVAELFLIS